MQRSMRPSLDTSLPRSVNLAAVYVCGALPSFLRPQSDRRTTVQSHERRRCPSRETSSAGGHERQGAMMRDGATFQQCFAQS